VTKVCRKNGRKDIPWFSWRTDEEGFTLVELMAVITFPFHKQRYHSQTRPN
jgi:hypothetical protein